MKQNLKKIGLLLIALLIFSVTISCADAPSLQTINAEIEEKFGYPNYFKPSMPGVGDFNYAILEKYRVPVYGEPHGGQKDVAGKMEPRFLGYNEFGESVPNPKFPHDSITDKPFSKMDWFEEPWWKDEIKNLERFKNIKKTYFDNNREAFKEDFLNTMENNYGKTNKFDLNRDKTFPWENYYHIVLPPTTKTFGVAILFHRDNNNKVWYLEVPILPTEKKRDQLTIQYRLNDGTKISEDRHKTLTNSIQLTAPTFKDLTYSGYGYSVDSANPPRTENAKTLTISPQTADSPKHYYVTFYYQEDTLLLDDTITGQIVISHPVFKKARPANHSVPLK